MKIAVSSTGPTLNDRVDPRFGRCAYFVVVDTDDMSYEAFDNESIALGGGAGIQSAQFVANQGVQGVITGNCGPNAVQTLSASHVKVYVGQSGTVRDVVERFRKGEIKSTSTPNVTSHYGMGGGAGVGRGMGRGMRATGTRGPAPAASTPSSSGDTELKQLKEQADEMRQKLEQIEASINSLENK